MFAYDYPVLSIFVTMLWFFLWVIWLFLLFRTIADIFRSEDLGGVSKFIWLVFVIVLPYLGVFVYVIARGHKMSAREISRVEASEAEMQKYIRGVAGSGQSTADELAKLSDLRERGVLSDAEFEQQKARLLAG